MPAPARDRPAAGQHQWRAAQGQLDRPVGDPLGELVQRQRGDAGQGLGVQQQEQAGDPVDGVQVAVVQQSAGQRPAVVERVNSLYPSTQDPEYAKRLQGHVRGYLSSDHPVFDVVDRQWLRHAAAAEEVTRPVRFGLERALDLALWLDMYKPVLKLS